MSNAVLWCFHHKAKAEEEEAAADPAVLAELQREVEDLKMRLHMAAEHYKEKYKECQRLQKQVLKLSEQPGVGPTRYRMTNCIHAPGSMPQIPVTLCLPVTLNILRGSRVSLATPLFVKHRELDRRISIMIQCVFSNAHFNVPL